AARFSTITRWIACRTRASSFTSMKRRPTSRLVIASPMRPAISSRPRMLVAPGHEVLEGLGSAVVPLDLRRPVRRGALDDPGFRDPVRDAPPREGVAVVVVEPARPAPADAARLDADPSGVEVEHGEPVAR